MGHLNSRLIWHKYAEPYFKEGKEILEIGPAGYPTYFEKELKQKGINTKYRVLDIGADFISGAEKRIPITFEDPKEFDNTPQQAEKYEERSLQIASEMFYVFSQIKKS